MAYWPLGKDDNGDLIGKKKYNDFKFNQQSQTNDLMSQFYIHLVITYGLANELHVDCSFTSQMDIYYAVL